MIFFGGKLSCLIIEENSTNLFHILKGEC